MAIARLEKPHCGNSAVPFMNKTTSSVLTRSAMRLWASLTVYLRWHCCLELQCVKLSPYTAPKRRIDSLMLPDPAHSREAPADHARRIMIAVASEITDRHLGVRYGRRDQPLDLFRRHRHQRPRLFTGLSPR